MRTLKQGQRVVVKTAQAARGANAITINALGTVHRLRSDGVAWVELDERSKESTVHPFDDDGRRRRVLAFPEDCELPKTNAVERRAAEREKSKPQTIPIAMFGRDHWSTLAIRRSIRCSRRRITSSPTRRSIRRG